MDFIYQYDLHLVFRLIVAGICGIAVGFERKRRAKEAGIRTHCLVACASALSRASSARLAFSFRFMVLMASVVATMASLRGSRKLRA